MNEDEIMAMLQQRFRELLAGDYILPVIEICQIILSMDPEDEHARFRYADKLREIGRMTEALPLLLEARNRIKGEKLWYVVVSLGRLYEALGKFAEAEEQYRCATELNPNTTATWVLLGGILIVQNRLGDAINALMHGLQAGGDLDEVHLNLGLCLRTLGDYSGAIGHLESALEITPDYPQAKLALRDIRVALEVKKQLSSLMKP